MIILSDNGKKLIDCASVFVRPVKDTEDLNKVKGYKVVGCTLTGRNETLAECDDEDSAKEYILNAVRKISTHEPVFFGGINHQG